MSRVIDLVGQRYGRLLVLRLDRLAESASFWVCRCDCGTEKSIRSNDLRRGKVKSCGCLHREVQRASPTRFKPRHGMSESSTWWIWHGLRARCNNPNDPAYPRYGKRGIKVCERWAVFENFLADMGERPSKAHSIDRKDNDGDYEPSNCRWATRKEQARNRRTNRLITYAGRTQTIFDWAEEKGLSLQLLAWRIEKGWSLSEALETPARKWIRKKKAA